MQNGHYQLQDAHWHDYGLTRQAGIGVRGQAYDFKGDPDIVMIGSANYFGRYVQVPLTERLSQATWPGKACTSSTSWVSPERAAVPHTPWPRAIRIQAGLPQKGPSTSSARRVASLR